MLSIQEKVSRDEHGVGDEAEVVQDPKPFRRKATTPIVIALRAGCLRGRLSPTSRPKASAQLLLQGYHPKRPTTSSPARVSL